MYVIELQALRDVDVRTDESDSLLTRSTNRLWALADKELPEYLSHSTWNVEPVQTRNVPTRHGETITNSESSKTVTFPQVFHYTSFHREPFADYLARAIHDHPPDHLGEGEEPQDNLEDAL